MKQAQLKVIPRHNCKKLNHWFWNRGHGSQWITLLQSKRSNLLWHYLGRSNAVDKTDLLETFLAHGEADLPAFVDNLVDHIESVTNFVHLVLHI